MLTQGGSCRCFTSGDDDRQREEAHRSWLKTLPPGSMIGMEASGCYHQCLADRAAALGFTVYVLNPKDVAYYAKALGQRGKTDRLDARTIARYLAHEGHDLHPYGPPTARQREIAALLQRRAALVKHAVALEQSLSGAGFLNAKPAVPAPPFVTWSPPSNGSSRRSWPKTQRSKSAASVCNPSPVPYFANLLAKGLSKTAAYCALARKIVRVAFAVWNSNTPFNPALLGKKG